MLQCPAGELSMRVEKRTAKNGNAYLRYIFSKVKCRKCPLRESCRVGRGKSKERSYSITQASEKNMERLKFEESEYFRERMKIRHRIEEKNGDPRITQSGFERAVSHGTANVYHSICGKCQENHEAGGTGYVVRELFSLYGLE